MSQEEKDKIKDYQRRKYQELLQDKKEALKKINNFFVFLSIKRMSEQTLKFNNIWVIRKNSINLSKQLI